MPNWRWRIPTTDTLADLLGSSGAIKPCSYGRWSSLPAATALPQRGERLPLLANESQRREASHLNIRCFRNPTAASIASRRNSAGLTQCGAAPSGQEVILSPISETLENQARTLPHAKHRLEAQRRGTLTSSRRERAFRLGVPRLRPRPRRLRFGCGHPGPERQRPIRIAPPTGSAGYASGSRRSFRSGADTRRVGAVAAGPVDEPRSCQPRNRPQSPPRRPTLRYEGSALTPTGCRYRPHALSAGPPIPPGGRRPALMPN